MPNSLVCAVPRFGDPRRPSRGASVIVKKETLTFVIAFVTTETVILPFFTWLLLCVLRASVRNAPAKIFLLVCKDFSGHLG